MESRAGLKSMSSSGHGVPKCVDLSTHEPHLTVLDCWILGIVDWPVWIMMDCTAAVDPTTIVASTAPLDAGRPPGSGQLGRAVRNCGHRITKCNGLISLRPTSASTAE